VSVLVTGGAGYIGSHAVLALVDQGEEVIVLDNLTRGHRRLVDESRVELVVGDIGDRHLVRNILTGHPVESVMHFAACAYVGESMKCPAKYYQNNVASLINLLNETVGADVSKFIFSSTCATYGEPAESPVTESCPQVPVNPYGAGKLMAERILRDYDRAYGLKSVVFRYFNAAGADPQLRSGERHEPETHLIPLVLDTAAGGRSDISVYGRDYPTFDGTCIRDYVHVTDVAGAHLQGLKFLIKQGQSDTFNLSNGQGYSVQEVIDTAARVTGSTIPVVSADRRPGDPPVLIGNSDKARRLLGWEPQYRALEEIIQHAWSWHQLSSQEVAGCRGGF